MQIWATAAEIPCGICAPLALLQTLGGVLGGLWMAAHLLQLWAV